MRSLHEILDNTVEFGALVANAILERGAVSLDSSREGTEVLSSLGNGLVRPC